jgi:hypothetical protein
MPKDSTRSSHCATKRRTVSRACRTTPFATNPLYVSTSARTPVSGPIATARVFVPPTSMPILMSLLSLFFTLRAIRKKCDCGWPGALLPGAKSDFGLDEARLPHAPRTRKMTASPAECLALRLGVAAIRQKYVRRARGGSVTIPHLATRATHVGREATRPKNSALRFHSGVRCQPLPAAGERR